MKIIERHELPRKVTVTHRITCEKCHSVFEANEDDFRKEVVSQGTCGNVINCPVCDNHISDYYYIGAENWEIIRS